MDHKLGLGSKNKPKSNARMGGSRDSSPSPTRPAWLQLPSPSLRGGGDWLHHAGIKLAAGARRCLGTSTCSTSWRSSFPSSRWPCPCRRRKQTIARWTPSGLLSFLQQRRPGRVWCRRDRRCVLCACRMPSHAYIKRLSMLPQLDSGCLDRRGGNGCGDGA